METYFVRSRGKIAGPFELVALQQLVRRGKLSRFDQLSSDRAVWRSAGDLSSLFTAEPPRVSAASHAVAHESNDMSAQPVSGSSAAGMANSEAAFYYAQNGAVVGPLALSVLQILAGNGTLNADDPVWAEGSDIASPAKQVPMLAPAFTPHSGHRSSRSATSLSGVPYAKSVQATQLYAKIVYFIVASVSLVFSLMPMTIVEGRAVWWWDLNGQVVAATIYLVLSSIALLIITPLVSNIARSITAIALVGVPMLTGLLGGLLQAADLSGAAVLACTAVWGMVVVPILLTAVNRTRSTLAGGGPTGARAVQIVIGALMILGASAGVVLLCMASDFWLTSSKASMRVAYLCTWLGVLSNLGAGVLAVISGKPRFSHSLNGASLICLAGAGGAFVLAAMACGTLLNDMPSFSAGPIAYALFRNGVLVIAGFLWLFASARELLAVAFKNHAE